jgi:uncharacterized protein YjeT (DUF2065 family)
MDIPAGAKKANREIKNFPFATLRHCGEYAATAGMQEVEQRMEQLPKAAHDPG